jgi:hypothetical protein
MVKNSNNNNIPTNIINKGDIVTDENRAIVLIAISETYKVDDNYCFDACIIASVDKTLVGMLIKRLVLDGYIKCNITIDNIICYN